MLEALASEFAASWQMQHVHDFPVNALAEFFNFLEPLWHLEVLVEAHEPHIQLYWLRNFLICTYLHLFKTDNFST